MNNYDVFLDSLEAKKWAGLGSAPLTPMEDRLIGRYLTEKKSHVLEAGCGSGRISFALEEAGLEGIDAFDYSESMLAKATDNKAIRNSRVKFFCMEASDLTNLVSNSYDYLVYLQQVICFLPPDRIENALSEGRRVLRRGGIAIFSYLNYRKLSFRHMCRLKLLKIVRRIRNEDVPDQCLPWVRLGQELNQSFFSRGQSCNYWFRQEEFIGLLERTGFAVVETRDEPTSRSSFVVCRK